jgi:hypothetical protein
VSTTINFKTTLAVGEQEVPLASEIVTGANDSQAGVKNGFLFKLDRQPFDPPVAIYLGDLIAFLDTKLGVAGNYPSAGMQLISQAIPALSPANFKSGDQTIVNIREFSLNSTTGEFLFSFNVDVENSNPNAGLILLPTALSQWLKIKNLAVAFSATKKT